MKMKTTELIALSACTMMLTALGIDIMLPVFGEVREHFHLAADSTATAQIIVFFFLGQIAQIIFGALSDRFGRLAILRIGFPLYILGGIVAAYAPTLETLFAARFVAGVGASAVFTTTIAGIRDRFAGDQMARILSLIFTVFLSTPVVAPFLGLAIQTVASWRMVFLTPPLFAILVFVWSLRLEESLPVGKRSTLHWASLIGSIRTVLGNAVFLRYTSITTLLFAGLSSWVASSEYIVGGIYRSPGLFAWVFASIGLWMSVCTLVNSRLSLRYGARRSLRWLLVGYTAVATVLLVWAVSFGDPPSMAVFFVALALLMGINLAVEPNSSALAMEPMAAMAGMASAVYGTFFFFVGATLGAVISNRMQVTVFPLIVSFFLIGIITLALAFSDRRPQAVPVGENA
jgi:DHA1 family bicyclomycin/chloramphenicol resistance-like MFS transporter